MARKTHIYSTLVRLASVLVAVGMTGFVTAEVSRDRAPSAGDSVVNTFTVVDRHDSGSSASTQSSGDGCVPGWDNTIGQPGLEGPVSGARALTEHNGDLITAGSFSSAGGVSANHVARWDGSAWHSVGVIFGGPVSALAVYNGDLIAGGFFATSSGADNIARWDGASWQPLSTGISHSCCPVVRALTVYNGELIAGGFFSHAGGTLVNNIARWNGSTWQPLGAGVNEAVEALTVHNGELIAGGVFTSADGQTVNRIARWNGSMWQSIGSACPGTWQEGCGSSNTVRALTVYNGELIVGGQIAVAGTSGSIFWLTRWNGSSWQALGGGINNAVWALTEYDGDLIAGGTFWIAEGQAADRIAKWDGASWSPLGSGMSGGSVFALTAFDDAPVSGVPVLYAGGEFTTADGATANHIAAWGCPHEPECAFADLDCDGFVDGADLLILLSAWGECDDPENCTPDLNGDGLVDGADLLILLSNWG